MCLLSVELYFLNCQQVTWFPKIVVGYMYIYNWKQAGRIKREKSRDPWQEAKGGACD